MVSEFQPQEEISLSVTNDFQPYVGPRPFESDDRDIFFGREREADDLLSLIIAHDVVLIYAQSGAGKTSLLNARLIPELQEEGFEVLNARVRGGIIPENVAFEEIQNIYVFNTAMSWSEAKSDAPRLAHMPLKDHLKERAHVIDEDGLLLPRVIIFDQFEEIVTFYPERWADRKKFFEQIRDVLEEDDLLRVVFIMREDYIAQLDPYTSILPNKLRIRFRLERLRREAALPAVVGPLDKIGVSFESSVAEAIVEDLMEVRYETITGDTAFTTGEFVEPVQLQVVCYRLWQSLQNEVKDGKNLITKEDISEFGNATQALSDFYEDCIKKAVKETDVKEERLRRWFEDTLITSAETRSLVYRDERKGETGGIPNETVGILERLHIIRRETRSGSQWYELTHDRLIEPIQLSNKVWLADVLESQSKITIGGDIQGNVYQRITKIVTGDVQEQRHQRDRQVMLKNIKQSWVKGVLEKSLHGTALIELGLETRSEAVEYSWAVELEVFNQSEKILPPGTRILDVFDEYQSLLILGEPGSGKTIMLLELARSLITRAERDPSHPIPVVFNLFSWTSNKQSMTDWLVDELHTKYRVPKRVARRWVENNELLLLLDGLDEVSSERREACVWTINSFSQEHMMGMVICSRIVEYEALSTRLQLQGAVVLQPLTMQQIDSYLAGTDTELLGMRRMLQLDTSLQELPQSPLILSTMTLAYRGMSSEDLQFFASVESRRRDLFDSYVEQMLKRRGLDKHYSPEQTSHGLAWLAQKMSQHAQVIFLIEQLQPSWISGRIWRWIYILSSRLVGGLSIGISVWLMLYWLNFGLVSGSLFGLSVGLIDIFRLDQRDANITMKRDTRSRWPKIYILLTGVIGEIIFPTSFGVIGGLIFGLRGNRRTLANEIQTVEVLRWSWKGALKGSGIGLILGLIVSLISALDFGLRGGLFFGLSEFLYIMISDTTESINLLIFGLITTLSFGLIGTIIVGLSKNIVETKTIPEQGIRLSARNAMITGLLSALIFGLFGVLIRNNILTHFIDIDRFLPSVLNSLPIFGLNFAIAMGLLTALWYGGLDVIQHYTLRLILWWNGFIPRNLARFLDYATEHIILRKVGGGYIFIHRLLLEHFAGMNEK